MTKGLLKLFATVLAATILASCSKGGGASSSGSTTAPPSNWDSLVWDQGNWQ